MKLLNLGCGRRFHPEWINVDFISSGEGVIAHNLLKGIPFNREMFDAVYHSHVLEHFSKKDAKQFIQECFRVLKPGGILRVAVPDLEQIVRNYLQNLEGASAGDKEAALNYEWMMLELYDQTVRDHSGGEMADFFSKDKISNEKFVLGRIGEEGRKLREDFLKGKSKPPFRYTLAPLWKRLIDPRTYVRKIRNIFFAEETRLNRDNERFVEIGKFRSGGEIHQWMYDRYSLGKVLADSGFDKITLASAHESCIAGWKEYQLDSRDGTVFKPDSLFMEAVKP